MNDTENIDCESDSTEELYNIRVTVSQYAKRKLKVYCGIYDLSRGDALDKILCEMPMPGVVTRKAQKEK